MELGHPGVTLAAQPCFGPPGDTKAKQLKNLREKIPFITKFINKTDPIEKTSLEVLHDYYGWSLKSRQFSYILYMLN